jgi:hypothetical protein
MMPYNEAHLWPLLRLLEAAVFGPECDIKPYIEDNTLSLLGGEHGILVMHASAVVSR